MKTAISKIDMQNYFLTFIADTNEQIFDVFDFHMYLYDKWYDLNIKKLNDSFDELTSKLFMIKKLSPAVSKIKSGKHKWEIWKVDRYIYKASLYKQYNYSINIKWYVLLLLIISKVVFIALGVMYLISLF